MANKKRKYRQLEFENSKALYFSGKVSASNKLDLTMSNYIAVLNDLAPASHVQSKENNVEGAPLTLSRWVR